MQTTEKAQSDTPGLLSIKGPVVRMLLGGVFPLMAFYQLKKMGMPVEGALAACGMSLLVVAVYYAASRRFDSYSLLAVFFTGIEFAATMVSKSETFFLLAPVLYSVLTFLLFGVSSFFKRPLLLILAEDTVGTDAFSPELRASPHFLRCWRFLGLVWAGAYLLKALSLYVLYHLNMVDLMLTVRAAMDWPLWAVLFFVSYRFPAWYWGKYFTEKSSLDAA